MTGHRSRVEVDVVVCVVPVQTDDFDRRAATWP